MNAVKKRIAALPLAFFMVLALAAPTLAHFAGTGVRGLIEQASGVCLWGDSYLYHVSSAPYGVFAAETYARLDSVNSNNQTVPCGRAYDKQAGTIINTIYVQRYNNDASRWVTCGSRTSSNTSRSSSHRAGVTLYKAGFENCFPGERVHSDIFYSNVLHQLKDSSAGNVGGYFSGWLISPGHTLPQY